MAYRMRMRKVNISRVVSRLVNVIISLYVGGTIVTELGNVMNGTTSAFYSGLTLIGWIVSATGQITATTGSGILSVIGIVGIASIVTEFVSFSM